MDVNQTIVKALEDIGVSYVFGGSGQVNARELCIWRERTGKRLYVVGSARFEKNKDRYYPQ